MAATTTTSIPIRPALAGPGTVAQTALFTAIPNGPGATPGTLRVLVHVSPHLLTTGALTDYPDWVDWPATLATINWTVGFPPAAITAPATQVGALADSARYTAMFPPTTPVTGHTYDGLDHRLLRSYPVRSIVDFLADRWGRFGATDPLGFPTYTDLVADDAFGPIGFELLGDLPETGPQRKARLVGDLEGQLDPTSNNPADWAVPFVDSLPPGQPALRDEIARRFLQLERFHTRGIRGVQPPGSSEPFVPDFHDILVLSRQYPLLQRLLGLAFELEFTLDRTLLGTTTEVQVLAGWQPAVANHPPVSTRTKCHIGIDASTFAAVPANPADTDLDGGYLRLGDATRFEVVTVDPDGGAIKAMQFADNVTRSRRVVGQLEKFSFYTPDRYALPAQGSAGLSVARLGRASELATRTDSQTDLNNGTFDANGKPTGTEPLLFAEDLVRGYRFDVSAGTGTVKGQSPGPWRSLMQRSGAYHFLSQGAAGEVPVDEEGTVVTGATTAGGPNPPDDLYLQESLARWGGWSLAGRMPGDTIGPTGDIEDPDSTEPPAFPFEADLDVTPGTLPRLRYGQTYRVRGRAVDITGHSEPLSATEPAGAPSAEVTYYRYEPVPSPLPVLRDPPAAPGETNEIVVVRSENGADQSPQKNARHLVPPRSSALLAEHHGLLDLEGQPGEPIDVSLYPILAARDAEDLETHDDGVPEDPAEPGGSRYFPVNHLSLNYLPDPLARGALVRGLPETPPNSGNDVIKVPFETAAWPNFDTFRLDLQKTQGPSSFAVDATNRTLTVLLAKAEDIDVPVSCYLAGTADLAALGIWQWIADWLSSHSGPFTLTQLRDMIIAGQHWMFTPRRTLRLVHAVRTPLVAPDLVDPQFSATKEPAIGATFANLSRLVAFHRKSTGRIDMVGTWSMKVDTGPKGPDPTAEHAFRAVAFELPIEHRSGGPDEQAFQEKHEFGDTLYRAVAYTAVATSAYTDFFRQSAQVTMAGNGPVVVDPAGLEAATVKVTDSAGTEYKRGPAGDYVVDGTAGTITRTPTGSIVTPATLDVAYVAPEINTISAPLERTVRSSARPAAPKVEYAIPTFTHEEFFGTRRRKGNTLRVYIQRPWWSSGDGEALGVVLWQGPSGDPPEQVVPYTTMWGFDPVVDAKAPPPQPTLSAFPLATATAQGVALAEVPGQVVDVAAHEVGFDAERDLWFCDIEVDRNTVDSHWPYLRLALARYQPNSLLVPEDLRLSNVVLADFAQLAPFRAVSVTPAANPGYRTVTVGGPAYARTHAQATPPIMQVTLEERQPGVADPDLGWLPAGAPGASTVELPVTNQTGDHNVEWSDFVRVPTTGGPYRLVVEEIEVHLRGTRFEDQIGPQGRRVVFIDIIDV